MFRRTLAALGLFVLCLLTRPTPAQFEPFDQCGTLVRNVACVYFVADNGMWVRILYPSSYNVGDRLRAQGFLVPNCIAPCPLSAGCINELVVGPCEPPPPPCPVDFNASGSVTVQDIFDFLTAYFLGDMASDYNASGSVTVQDIFDFLTAYFLGCP